MPGEAVSGDYFTVMRLGALRGPLLAPLDERESARVVVLSERFWRQHMRGDSGPSAADPAGGLPFEVTGSSADRSTVSTATSLDWCWIPVGADTGEREGFVGAWAT